MAKPTPRRGRAGSSAGPAPLQGLVRGRAGVGTAARGSRPAAGTRRAPGTVPGRPHAAGGTPPSRLPPRVLDKSAGRVPKMRKSPQPGEVLPIRLPAPISRLAPPARRLPGARRGGTAGPGAGRHGGVWRALGDHETGPEGSVGSGVRIATGVPSPPVPLHYKSAGKGGTPV